MCRSAVKRAIKELEEKMIDAPDSRVIIERYLAELGFELISQPRAKNEINKNSNVAHPGFEITRAYRPPGWRNPT